MAPHSTSVVPVSVSIATSHRSRAMPSGRSSKLVASRLLPAAMRPHIAAVYAFVRVADDIADEGTMPAEERRTRLAAWRRQLHAAAGSMTPAAVSGEHGSLSPNERESLTIAAAAQ